MISMVSQCLAPVRMISVLIPLIRKPVFLAALRGSIIVEEVMRNVFLTTGNAMELPTVPMVLTSPVHVLLGSVKRDSFNVRMAAVHWSWQSAMEEMIVAT